MLRAAQGVALALAARPLFRLERRAEAAPVARPRFLLQVIPEGGMDAVYTTDPKTVKMVEPGIDVPYPAKDIVDAKTAQLGPGFKALARWMPRLAIVNSFLQNSANHPAGLIHSTRFKGNANFFTPSLAEILGSKRDAGLAVSAINIGTTFNGMTSPKYMGEPGNFNFGTQPGLLEHLDAAAPEDLETASQALADQAASLAGRKRSDQRTTADNLREASALFHQVAHSPKFAPSPDWKHDLEEHYHAGRHLQRALWLFENRVARCVTVMLGEQDFDTHILNPQYQPILTSYLAFLLDKLFGELDRRIVDGKPLSEQTAVIIGSEIGRFPRINAANGKDHFPQASYLFFGPWFRTGHTYGVTGKQMESQPVSLRTGAPETGGHVLRVDDIGTTLMHLAGVDPEVYGYSGAHLDFLVA